MKQGIIFGILITTLSFLMIGYVKDNLINDLVEPEVVLVQDGEEIYSSPFLRKGQQVLWYVNENGKKFVLKDEEIIQYYNLDIKLKDLTNLEKIDMNKVYEVSGNDMEINMIINKDGYVEVIEANCPRKKDVKMGKIYDSSKFITCVPHKLMIKIKGVKGSDEVDA